MYVILSVRGLPICRDLCKSHTRKVVARCSVFIFISRVSRIPCECKLTAGTCTITAKRRAILSLAVILQARGRARVYRSLSIASQSVRARATSSNLSYKLFACEIVCMLGGVSYESIVFPSSLRSTFCVRQLLCVSKPPPSGGWGGWQAARARGQRGDDDENFPLPRRASVRPPQNKKERAQIETVQLISVSARERASVAGVAGKRKKSTNNPEGAAWGESLLEACTKHKKRDALDLKRAPRSTLFFLCAAVLRS